MPERFLPPDGTMLNSLRGGDLMQKNKKTQKQTTSTTLK
ncbi:hypothetical protein NT01EI_2201 [Edwardsiella ictaluri 93-146]|uniref:Uncharacterized protein n=1 Tax=Edwardsiella ictaluri (strain 93-146) TaxID=634503 RepID=C5BFU7_EDWI9|nr:hypothetical protein NT01EI_2201 [Edwardsiella ictaluri 93-146]